MDLLVVKITGLGGIAKIAWMNNSSAFSREYRLQPLCTRGNVSLGVMDGIPFKQVALCWMVPE